MSLVLDLNNAKIMYDNLQKNIKIIHKQYGNKFILKYDNILIPCHLYINKNSWLQYYILEYDIDVIIESLLPFKIYFIDYFSQELNDNCYIANIHKTNEITGTNMMNIILKFIKILNVKKVMLHDGATVTCNKNGIKFGLSFYKLIEKGITFYEKFGFKLTKKNDNSFHLQTIYKDDKYMADKLKELLIKFNNIKIADLITLYRSILKVLFQVINDQDYKNLTIFIFDKSKKLIIPVDELNTKVTGMINEINIILGLLLNSKHIYFRDLLIDFAQYECNKYTLLDELVLNNMNHKIIYNPSTDSAEKNTIIELNHVEIIDEINVIIHWSYRLLNIQ